MSSRRMGAFRIGVVSYIMLAGPYGNADAGSVEKRNRSLRADFCFTEAPFASCHASSLVEPVAGELLVTYFAGSREGAADVAIWLSRGQVGPDGTTVWSKTELAHREPGVPCWNPVLCRAGDELLLFFKAGRSPREWSGFLKRSNDGGRTWSDPALLPAGILGPIRSKPIRTADGRLICGSSVESYRAWGCWVEISSDAGGAWTKHGPINVPGAPWGIIQPSVFEISGGEFALLCRSRGIGKICRSESTDAGKMWSPARPIELPNPNAGIDATRLRDGRLLLIYNHATRGRTPLNIAVSHDDGKTFEPLLVLEDQPGEYSYPALIQTADGMVHCSYTWRRTRIKHVAFDPSKP